MSDQQMGKIVIIGIQTCFMTDTRVLDTNTRGQLKALKASIHPDAPKMNVLLKINKFVGLDQNWDFIKNPHF